VDSQEIQEFIINGLQQGHTHNQIATDLFESSISLAQSEAHSLVRKTCRDLVGGRHSIDQPQYLKELIKSTKEAQAIALEDRNPAAAVSAGNLLAKLVGLLD